MPSDGCFTAQVSQLTRSPQHRVRIYRLPMPEPPPPLAEHLPPTTFLSILHPGIPPLQEDALSPVRRGHLILYKHILEQQGLAGCLACVSLDRNPRAAFGPYFRDHGSLPALRTSTAPLLGPILRRPQHKPAKVLRSQTHCCAVGRRQPHSNFVSVMSCKEVVSRGCHGPSLLLLATGILFASRPRARAARGALLFFLLDGLRARPCNR